MKAKLRRLSKKEFKYKAQLAKAKEDITKRSAFDIITKNMTKAGKLLTGMQYRHALKKPKGRRCTTRKIK